MTKPDRKNKREYERKQRAEGGSATPKTGEKGRGAKKEAKENNARPSKPPSAQPAAVESSSSGPPPPTTLSNIKGEAESAEKLIAEANKRFLEAEEEKTAQVDPKYAKRNITSNWTKYELPSSDESEDEMTGADFNYVLSTAQGAESHFRLKSEQEWAENAEKLGELSQEFFSLDLVSLEKSISAIPLHKQIGLSEDSLDKPTLVRLQNKADAAKLNLSIGEINGKTQEVTQKLMDILKTTSKETDDKVGSGSEIPRLNDHLENLKLLNESPKRQDLETKPLHDILQYAKDVIKESKEAIEDYYADQKEKLESQRASLEDKIETGKAEIERLDDLQSNSEALNAPEVVNASKIENASEASTSVTPKVEALEQRTNRRQRGHKGPDKAVNEMSGLKGNTKDAVKTEVVTASVEDSLKAAESHAKEIEAVLQIPEEYKDFINNPNNQAETIITNDDLEFLDSLDKEIKCLEKKEKMHTKEKETEEETEIDSGPVVSVKIAKEETQNLEDWLDDFLDD